MKTLIKNILEAIKERIPAILVIIGLILYTAIMIIIFGIGYSNRYEDEIAYLEIENKKLEHALITKRKDNKFLTYRVEDLEKQVDGKKKIKCDCSWYEDFYYEHAAEVGAYE